MTERPPPTTTEQRKRIAAAWAHDAVMEHASIASFARFTLELLAIGAPADLVWASQQAGLDETGHAKACFGIASRLTGRKLGPGPLDVEGAVASNDLAAIIAGTVKEGCVGETLSALLAEARAERADDPEIRQVLTTISEEEARHAELAWRFLGWAIERGGRPIREAAVRAFDEALRQRPGGADPRLDGIPVDVIRAYGLLDTEAAKVVIDRAFLEMIGPLVADLARARNPAEDERD